MILSCGCVVSSFAFDVHLGHCGWGEEEVRHVSQSADSACPFLYWRDGKKDSVSQLHVVYPLGGGGREGRRPAVEMHGDWASVKGASSLHVQKGF